jgi:flagellar capping protein FliD
MATFQKFNVFVEDCAAGVHNLKTGTSHVFKVALTNSAPVATNTVLANITQISGTNGYTTGGNTATFTSGAQTSGTFKLTLADPAVWTASGGSMGPFRYAVLYNDTPTSPADPLIGFWDYGSSVTLAVGETFTVDLDQTNGVLTLA